MSPSIRTTVEPALRTPTKCGHLVITKSPFTFSTRITRTPFKADNGHAFLSSQQIDCQVCAVNTSY